MDQELKSYLDAMRDEFGTKLDAMGAEFGTKLDAMDAKFGTKLDAMGAEFGTKLDAMDAALRTHISEECEKVETKLLTEFWKWGRTSDMRTRQALGETAALGERLLAIEDRITALERKRAS